MQPLFGKTSVAIGVMLGILAVPYVVPGLTNLRVARAPWDKTEIAPDPTPEVAAAPVLEQGETTLKASQNEATVTNALPAGDTPAPAAPAPPKTTAAKGRAPVAIEDSGAALDAFYTSLARTRASKPGAVTRVLHYGDSMITSDYVSGTMRRKMQAEYGDAGHGFLLVANPWEWYFHNDVAHGAGEGWSSSRITGPLAKDGMYGLGGVTFTGRVGATAYFGTPEKGTHGKNVSRFDVYYLDTPNGGEVDAKIGAKNGSGDDARVERFATKAESTVSRVRSFTVPDGEARLSLRVVSGSPRLFGVALERDRAGVVYDALGANGARAELLNGMNGAHWIEQMALRKPSLVILQYGANESEAPGLPNDYERTLTALVTKLKAAVPHASIMIVAPLDRAENAEGGLRTKSIIKKLVAAQKNVAQATGIAFWNTYEAMGGEGSMARWVKSGLAGSDLTHPSPQGAEMIGKMLFEAIQTGFSTWLAAHPNAAETPAR